MIVCNYNYKYITAMDFAEHHRKLDVSENSKVIYG